MENFINLVITIAIVVVAIATLRIAQATSGIIPRRIEQATGKDMSYKLLEQLRSLINYMSISPACTNLCVLSIPTGGEVRVDLGDQIKLPREQLFFDVVKEKVPEGFHAHLPFDKIKDNAERYIGIDRNDLRDNILVIRSSLINNGAAWITIRVNATGCATGAQYSFIAISGLELKL